VRLIGLLLVILGVLGAAAGGFVGCGALFSWNGKHAIDVQTFTPGTPFTYSLKPAPDRRYTLGVDVVFDTTGLSLKDGALHVEAQMPITVRVDPVRGEPLASVTGWLDPNAPPTLLVGAGAAANPRTAATEVYAERLVGPFRATSADPLKVTVDLGADKLERVPIRSARLVVFDDAMPGSITGALGAGGAGVVVLLAGIALLFVGSLRKRAARRSESGKIRASRRPPPESAGAG
jgi:hypothetical protein